VPPARPSLDLFRLRCAKEGVPIVDIWQVPCGFPAGHYQVLRAMDGTRSTEELGEIASRQCPDLAFEPWLHHLAERGFFSHPAQSSAHL